MALQTVKCGVIGVGRMGTHHARVFSGLEGAELVGVVDNSEERRTDVVESWGGQGCETVEQLVMERIWKQEVWAENINNKADLLAERDRFQTALQKQSEREKFIVRERQIIDDPRTLESLGQELGLSKERVRQIEAAAFTKMRRFLEKNAREVQNFL